MRGKVREDMNRAARAFSEIRDKYNATNESTMNVDWANRQVASETNRPYNRATNSNEGKAAHPGIHVQTPTLPGAVEMKTDLRTSIRRTPKFGVSELLSSG